MDQQQRDHKSDILLYSHQIEAGDTVLHILRIDIEVQHWRAEPHHGCRSQSVHAHRVAEDIDAQAHKESCQDLEVAIDFDRHLDQSHDIDQCYATEQREVIEQQYLKQERKHDP